MNLGTLQSFAQALQAGQAASAENYERQLRAKQMQDQMAQQTAAQTALGKMFAQGGAPAPAAPPAATPSPAPAQQPIQLAPQVAQGLSPQAQQGLAAVNADGGAAPAKEPPMPGLSSTAQPDAAGMDDPIKAAQQSISSLAQGIKAANPGIDPRTLAAAVEQQIEQIKGVSPLTKAAMQSQVQMLRTQQDLQFKFAKLQEESEYHAAQLRELAKRGATQAQVAAERERHDRVLESLTGESISERATAAAGHDATRVQVANIGAASRTDVANINQGGAYERAGMRSDDSAANSASALFGRVYSAYMANHPGASEGEAARAANAAVQAMAGRRTPRAAPARSAPAPSRAAPQTRGPVQLGHIPPAAIQRLRANPKLRGDFDQQYGSGAAAAVLGR